MSQGMIQSLPDGFINKGDVLCPNYRSRLVAREFHTNDRPEWYAATPPGNPKIHIVSIGQ